MGLFSPFYNMDTISITDLLILSLAVWRISSLVAVEPGPFDMFDKLRIIAGVKYMEEPPYEMYGTNVISKGLICVWCNSIWFGFFTVLLYAITPKITYLFLPLALSTVAILVDCIIAASNKGE